MVSRFLSRHPIAFSALVVLVAAAAIELLGAGLTHLPVPPFASRMIIEGVFCGYVALLLTRLRWWQEAGFTRPRIRRSLMAFLPLLLLPIAVVASSGFKAASVGQMTGYAILTLMVGFAEEGLLRGVALRAMLPIGPTRAAVLSSLFFGIGHLLNLGHGPSPSTVVVQVIYSTLLGIGFAGVRLYAGTIWPVIAAHSLIDFADVASRGFVLAPPRDVTLAGVVAPIVITSLYALYGWWLLRRTGTKDADFADAAHSNQRPTRAARSGG
jgi:membrane protease YdiL (CAAX protease family)